MNTIRIDLSSDTATRPTQAMRDYMCRAEVGDEQRREDPTVNKLVEKVCELLGKEDAVFLPSGTMCNEIAFRIHCRPGDEIIMDRTYHPFNFETGGPAVHSGASIYPLEGNRGIFSAVQVKNSIRPADNHFPRSRVVAIEQTTNLGGGAVWPVDAIQAICAEASKYGLARHMDGARLMNAVVASGNSADQFAAGMDSVWLDFTKGLGAPVGAVLAGSKDLIREAWRLKHQFGGAMRQSGILAAAAVFALENHVERLADDHENARLLARGLMEIGGIQVEPVETNLVFFDPSGLGLDAAGFIARLLTYGIRVSMAGSNRNRAVTHLDVTTIDIKEALRAIREITK